eukprot:5380161-Pyramimonas_sp.AAC.1
MSSRRRCRCHLRALALYRCAHRVCVCVCVTPPSAGAAAGSGQASRGQPGGSGPGDHIRGEADGGVRDSALRQLNPKGCYTPAYADDAPAGFVSPLASLCRCRIEA